MRLVRNGPNAFLFPDLHRFVSLFLLAVRTMCRFPVCTGDDHTDQYRKENQRFLGKSGLQMNIITFSRFHKYRMVVVDCYK